MVNGVGGATTFATQTARNAADLAKSGIQNGKQMARARLNNNHDLLKKIGLGIVGVVVVVLVVFGIIYIVKDESKDDDSHHKKPKSPRSGKADVTSVPPVASGHEGVPTTPAEDAKNTLTSATATGTTTGTATGAFPPAVGEHSQTVVPVKHTGDRRLAQGIGHMPLPSAGRVGSSPLYSAPPGTRGQGKIGDVLSGVDGGNSGLRRMREGKIGRGGEHGPGGESILGMSADAEKKLVRMNTSERAGFGDARRRAMSTNLEEFISTGQLPGWDDDDADTGVGAHGMSGREQVELNEKGYIVAGEGDDGDVSTRVSKMMMMKEGGATAKKFDHAQKRRGFGGDRRGMGMGTGTGTGTGVVGVQSLGEGFEASEKYANQVLKKLAGILKDAKDGDRNLDHSGKALSATELVQQGLTPEELAVIRKRMNGGDEAGLTDQQKWESFISRGMTTDARLRATDGYAEPGKGPTLITDTVLTDRGYNLMKEGDRLDEATQKLSAIGEDEAEATRLISYIATMAGSAASDSLLQIASTTSGTRAKKSNVEMMTDARRVQRTQRIINTDKVYMDPKDHHRNNSLSITNTDRVQGLQLS